MRVVVSEFMNEAALENFESEIDVIYAPDLVDDREGLLKALSDADAVIVRNRTQVDKELLEAAPRLKAVGRLGVGLDNIDLKTCKKRGIQVLPATGANANSVAEYVIASAMLLSRGTFYSTQQMTTGDWPRAKLGKGGEIAGRTLGLVGFGGIAQLVAHKATALGMSVVAYDPFLPTDNKAWNDVQQSELIELLQRSDVVSLHVPLTTDTANMLDEKGIEQLKDGAVLINTSRGGIVDEAALVGALKSGKLSGAAIDVFENEPLDKTSAKMFKNCPNLVLTPHIAGVTHEANIRVSDVTVENVRRVLEHAG